MTIDPPPRSRIIGTAARMAWTYPLRLTSKVLSHWLSPASRRGPKWGLVAALFTSTSIPPKASCARAISAWTSASRPVWQATASASPPAARIFSATDSTPSSLRLASTTRAPAAPNASAIASPIPREAPVTTTTRPANDFSMPATIS